MARKPIWDKIYKDYEKGGKAWASLKDSIHLTFVSFVKRMCNTGCCTGKFVLDLGCGNGKYLAFLQEVGFDVVGVDSSPTAIKMARKKLGKEATLQVADMYTSDIRKKFNLIISIAAIQHADKSAIVRSISKIHRSLLPNGKVFITFPRMSMASRWNTFKEAKQIAPGTYIPIHGPEKGLVHSFYKKDELAKLFSGFSHVKIAKDDMGRWIVKGEK